MTNAPALAADADIPRQQLMSHLKSALGMAPQSVDVIPTQKPNAIPGAREFYIEVKGSREHGSSNCVVMAGQVYCSPSAGDFARILKEQALLERDDIGAAQWMNLYAVLQLPRQLRYIGAQELDSNPQAYRAYPEITSPAVSKDAQGTLTLVFFTSTLRSMQPLSKWTVAMSRAGRVDVKQEVLPARD